MLEWKGLMFRHLRMMHSVVIIWPMEFLLLLFAVLRKIVSSVITLKGFSCKQNIVNSRLTSELPVRSFCQRIELQRFDLTFTIQYPTWFPRSHHIPQ